MSKKSRKRNKKILGALAAGLGAMALMKRKKASVANTAANEDANIGVTHSALGDGPYITKKPIIKKPTDDSWLDTPKGPHGAGGKGDYWRKQKALALTAGNKVPPSMRGGEQHAEGYQRYVAPNRQWPGGYIGRKGGGIAKRGTGVALKHGGSVTGAAKRGFGRALMKGKK